MLYYAYLCKVMNYIPHMLKIFTDGASRGNPGPAACSYIIKDEKGVIIESSAEFLGHTTNNVAEYTAVIKALTKAAEQADGELQVFSDSQLIIRQITGVYRINKPHLQTLYNEVKNLIPRFSHISWDNVPRNNPDVAYCDRLCNEKLDQR